MNKLSDEQIKEIINVGIKKSRNCKVKYDVNKLICKNCPYNEICKITKRGNMI